MANIVRRDPDQGFGLQAPYSYGWDPFRLMREMLSADPFRQLGVMQPISQTWTPQFEVRENSDAYVIAADLPGMSENELEISMTGNRLVISGHREAEDRREDDNFITYERSFGSFTRAFVLPEGIEADSVQAELRNGVLSVRVPRAQESRPRKISVKRLIDKVKSSLGAGEARPESQQAGSERMVGATSVSPQAPAPEPQLPQK